MCPQIAEADLTQSCALISLSLVHFHYPFFIASSGYFCIESQAAFYSCSK